MPGDKAAPYAAEQVLCWRPGGLERHATRASGCRGGEVFTALCGRDVAADSGDLSWFVSTCPDCYAVANDLAEGCDD